MHIVAALANEAIGVRLQRTDDAPRIGQLLQMIEPHDVAQRRRERHIGHETPLDFHDRQARLLVCKADIGTRSNLHASTETEAVDGRNDRHRQREPDPGRQLEAVGRCAVQQLIGLARKILEAFVVVAHVADVEPGAEVAAGAAQ